jgi:hypothetical protein
MEVIYNNLEAVVQAAQLRVEQASEVWEKLKQQMIDCEGADCTDQLAEDATNALDELLFAEQALERLLAKVGKQ